MKHSPRTITLALFLMALAHTGAASVPENHNTTVQTGQVNINRTAQCGESNTNSTYQDGRININQTTQGCGHPSARGRPGRGPQAGSPEHPTRGRPPHAAANAR